MLAYVNGRYFDESQPALAVNDRSFRYGDGLFETVRVTNGIPFLWEKHMARLARGAEFLKTPAPDVVEIAEATRHLLAQNDCPEGMVRIHLSRGEGGRGYSMKESGTPTLVITTHKGLHSAPAFLRLITSNVRVLSGDPVNQHKTANRLGNIRARQEAEAAGVDEALILNGRGNIAGASAANVFRILGNELLTPSLSDGALAGTTREFIMETAVEMGLRVAEGPLMTEELHRADVVFLTSAGLLAVPVATLDGIQLGVEGKAWVAKFRRACEEHR
jgi:branched-chain amino acid aminotransferase